MFQRQIVQRNQTDAGIGRFRSWPWPRSNVDGHFADPEGSSGDGSGYETGLRKIQRRISALRAVVVHAEGAIFTADRVRGIPFRDGVSLLERNFFRPRIKPERGIAGIGADAVSLKEVDTDFGSVPVFLDKVRNLAGRDNQNAF